MKIFVTWQIGWNDEIKNGVYELTEEQVIKLKELYINLYNQNSETDETINTNTVDDAISDIGFENRWFRLNKKVGNLVRTWKLVCEVDYMID